MELVYLWVEDYKNIHKQGFNFSPRFECEFKDEYDEDGKLKDNCELIIKPKEHLENFFGKNINVTAIVGENGSGKSSLINATDKSLIQIYSKNRNLCSPYTKKYNCEIKIETCTIDEFHITFVELDLIKINIENWTDIIDCNSSLYGKMENGVSVSKFDIKKFEKNFYNLIIKYRNLFESKIFTFNPTHIDLTFNDKDIQAMFKELIESLKKLSPKTEIKIFEEIYKKNKDKILELINLGILNINLFEKMEDEKYKTYFDLSQGERKLFTENLMIYDDIYRSEKENILLLLDEPDLALHPTWQKNYINEMINMLSDFKKNIHIIITSHSPFILSDLPKKNVIFLDRVKIDNNKTKKKYPKLNIDNLKDGSCINVSNYMDINPFGANIHTLLSNGFFMQDGLMGEFAKSKIDEVIKYLKSDEESIIQDDKEAKSIIDIIGEPILKNTLQTMYDAKVYKDESKLDALKRKQKEIEEAIKQEESNEES